MRSLFVLLMLTSLLGVLLLAGCNAQTNTPATSFNDSAVGYTVYLENSAATTSADSRVRAYDVRLVGDDGFFPTTFEANVGDTVRLFFALQEPHYITIEDMGIGSMVQTELIEFVPERKGAFEMVCVDCDPEAVALITVN